MSFPAKSTIILAFGMFVVISIMLYLKVDSNERRRQATYGDSNILNDNSIQKLEERLESLNKDAQNNKKLLNKIESKIENSNNKEEKNEDFYVNNDGGGKDLDENSKKFNRHTSSANSLQFCSSKNHSLAHNAVSDVQMLSVYDILPFDNPNGGVWKQGWPITYDYQKIKEEKRLEVIVIPHSHCDPGWIKTFEKYYEDQVQNILNFMVTYLTQNKDLKFIFAEISFFELWWSKQTNKIREKVKQLLINGQFEIVTGGWVMTDEANAHYYSIIMELFEGHEFLKNQLDYIPRNHWSIDPFGLSPTLAYLLNRSNFTHMAIQRICCQFDFRRLRGLLTCPWGVGASPITRSNVEEFAQLLADQYRKKAQLYGFNTILVPLGDDFRYDIEREWTEQYTNYKKLFDYINSKSEWNINARFGTLSDYFEVLERRLNEKEEENLIEKEQGKYRHNVGKKGGKGGGLPSPLPILSGDFFTYSDRDDHYWSGYFTSRPFYKHLDRSLQHYLRAADIFFSLVNWKGKMPTNISTLYNSLVNARRALSLFQHHDGVTGTAKSLVMDDYGEKMSQALSDTKNIIARSSEFLLGITPEEANQQQKFKIDLKHFKNKLAKKIIIKEESTLIITNSLGHFRKEIVCIYVNNIKFKIVGNDGKTILQQIEPIFFTDNLNELSIYKDKYSLCFEVELPPFGLITLNVLESENVENKVKLQTFKTNIESILFELTSIKENQQQQQLYLSNNYIKAFFDPITGYLKSIKDNNGEELDIFLSFVRYGARGKNPARTDGGDSLSGAYLFLPDGPAVELESNKNQFVIVKGIVREYIFVNGPPDFGINHQLILDKNSKTFTLLNHVNMESSWLSKSYKSSKNFELAMKLKIPSIKQDNFYTDLNGFQMIRRRKQNNLPLQAHFYPMPGSAFIENSNDIRVSLYGRQALGVASLELGEIQVMLDRRLLQDDDLGLGQAVDDNIRAESQFLLNIERFTGTRSVSNDTVGFHSLLGEYASLKLLYPPIILFNQKTSLPTNSFSGLKNPFPCDIHPVAFRTLSESTIYGLRNTIRDTSPKYEAALVLRRFGIECTLDFSLEDDDKNCGFNLSDIFIQTPKSFSKGTLTLLENTKNDTSTNKEKLIMEPMEEELLINKAWA
uniref:Alpha-mannosidase n=1 Tax=Meloidogyne floridensis TaxID=298350 RepID=A0A915NJJ2_9BILA